MSGFQAIFFEKLYQPLDKKKQKSAAIFIREGRAPPVSGPLDRAPVSMADARHVAAPTGPSNIAAAAAGVQLPRAFVRHVVL